MLDAVAAIEAAFPPEGATLRGTRLLLAPEGIGPEPSRPASWREVAERIDQIDWEALHSLEAEDFRIYLPGLLLGCLCHLRDDAPPYAETILFGLIWGNDDRYWDDRFLARWGGFSREQLDAVERAIDLLLPEPPPEMRDALFARLGPSQHSRARDTLDLLRLRLALA